MSSRYHMLNNRAITWSPSSTPGNYRQHQVRRSYSKPVLDFMLYSIVISSPGPSVDRLDYEVSFVCTLCVCVRAHLCVCACVCVL